MSVIYKTLFELRLLHEFYLTRRDGTTVFEKLTQEERETFLHEEFMEGNDPINDDVQFCFPQGMKSKYESLYLKILPTYSGCRIAVRVNAKTLPDQTTVFEPYIPFSTDMHIFILALKNNQNLEFFSNKRLRSAIPATYYFSNAEVDGAKTFPFLTNSVPVQDGSYMYEQGELSLSGAVVQEFYRNGNTDVFRDVKGNGFANESDRILLPGRFDYVFADNSNLTQVTLNLKDYQGNELVSFSIDDDAGLGEKISVDFNGYIKQLPITTAFKLEQQFHTLLVTGNNGFSAIHKVIFSNELTLQRSWSVFDISASVSDNPFNLLANDSFLVRRKNALGIWSPAPVFEIPVKSRLAYWRYINNKGKELNVPASLANYVKKEGMVLVTKVPRASARSWFLLREETSSSTTYAPNPYEPIIKMENDRRSFFDIRVPDSELFPEV